MEKILLAAFLSSLAGFITAVVSIVKLVNEKENKTSEFRQLWTNSVRSSISDLSAKMGAVTLAFEYENRLMDIEHSLSKKTGEIAKGRLEHIRAALLKVREEARKDRHDQYQAFALCKLHFKPNDDDFQPLEQAFNRVREHNKKIRDAADDAERKKILSKNYDEIQTIIEAGQAILKGEWERVKEGERAYKNTKTYSLWGGGLMLAILFLVGGYALFLTTKSVEADDSGSKVEIPISCWKLQKLEEKVLKFNSCTGELVEFNGEQQTKNITDAGAKGRETPTKVEGRIGDLPVDVQSTEHVSRKPAETHK